ncbi:MAG: type II secretion system protein N [Pseudomonadota bacterium]
MLTQKSLENLNIFALAAALAVAGWVGYDIYNRHMAAKNSPQEFSFSTQRSTDLKIPANMRKVIDAHLFGVVPKKVVETPAPAPKPEVTEAPKTRLNVTLTGLVSGTATTPGVAMIEVKRGETTVVKEGQKIGNTGAILQSVRNDHVLIEHRGSVEKLQIERQTLELTALASSNQKTISALNISESEFQRLQKQEQELQNEYRRQAAEQDEALRRQQEASASVSENEEEEPVGDDEDGDAVPQTPEDVLQQELEAELRRQQAEDKERLQTLQQQSDDQQLLFKDDSANASAGEQIQLPGALKRL